MWDVPAIKSELYLTTEYTLYAKPRRQLDPILQSINIATPYHLEQIDAENPSHCSQIATTSVTLKEHKVWVTATHLVVQAINSNSHLMFIGFSSSLNKISTGQWWFKSINPLNFDFARHSNDIHSLQPILEEYTNGKTDKADRRRCQSRNHHVWLKI